MEYCDEICFLDLEDDVWRTLSDPTDGPVLYLHRCHLQWVLQQRPQCVRLRVACWTHVRKEHLEVRTFKIPKPPFLSRFWFAQFFLCMCFVLSLVVPQCWLEPPTWPLILLSLGPSRALIHLALIRYGRHIPQALCCVWVSAPPVFSFHRSIRPHSDLCSTDLGAGQ